MRTIAAFTVAIACASCSTGGLVTSAQPERLAFVGTLDLAGQGVGFLLTHTSGLSCSGRYPSGKLPASVSVDVTCGDELTGVLTVIKANDLRGVVSLSDNRQGDVVFEQPPAPGFASQTPPSSRAPSSGVLRTTVTQPTQVRRARGGCGSRGGAGYRLPNGKCASRRSR